MPSPAAVRRSRRMEGPLTLATIVEAALAIARTEGIDVLTMRRLAADLRTAPMSVYRHVTDRQEILIAMLDAVAKGIVLPPVAGESDAEIIGVFTAIHDALRADIWAVDLIVVNKLASAQILPAIERVYLAMRSAGLSASDTAAGYALLWQYTVGELLDTAHSQTDEYRKQMVRDSDRRRYPVMHEVLTEISHAESDTRYAENLRRIVDGILT
ncbi:TetR/AcrR family transcriptional regulator [Mycolicibacterium houstonense]|uniref:TetR/AcrR family transcriptional regulator n=2 Tax=Mycolicibacterium houstonense TaxID=146021 RepID=UPI000A03E82A|nr:TetR/AcrR family transcriptional regulator C-terminal domain-containing protein [Mycolicibacterium houstonense]